MTRRDLGINIHRVAYSTGQFLLRSGIEAHEYFDKYQFESDPRLLREVAVAMRNLLPAAVDVLAGLELGGIPLVTMLSQETGLPALFVRKVAKTYGTCRLAEGGDVSRKRLAIIEDVVTSGGQIVESTQALRALGATIDTAVCVIDREAGGTANLASAGITLSALFRVSEIDQWVNPTRPDRAEMD